MVDPQIPTVKEFTEANKENQHKIIYKLFVFYIPLIKLIKFGAPKGDYNKFAVYHKLESLIFNEEINRVIANLAGDGDAGDSIIHIPE